MTHTRKILTVLFLVSASAFAANVQMSISGVFAANTPVTTYSAPNAAWSLTFQVGNPPVINSTGGTPLSQFTTNYTNPVYIVGANTIPLTGSQVTFYNGLSPVTNGLSFSLDAAQTFILVSEFIEPTLFTGSPSTPTFAVPSSFAISQMEFIAPASSTVGGTNETFAITALAPSGTPAPTSVILVALGLAALAIVEMLRRQRAAA